MDRRDGEGRGSLTRRAFVGAGVAGAVAAGIPRWALGKEIPQETPQEIPEAEAKAFELEEATIADLQAGMESGRFTSRSLVEAYLDRIEDLDRRGPRLRSVLETNPEAMAIAEALDAERREKGPRGPLHGVPLLVKDNLDTADRMSTTAGSLALAGSVAARDSFVAARLRAAGAVLLGKTNLSEWANFRSTRSTSGWSGRGGQTRNPYALDRSPSGSSSGSGSAIAASLAAAAIGTETDGSIVSPSAACSLVGLKPTVGLVSRSGIIPIAASQDTAGPMTRTVADAAVLLGAIAGADDSDDATRASRGRSPADYRKFLDPNGLKGARIGVARKGFLGSNPVVDRIVEDALDAMRRQGATVVDPADLAEGEYGEDELEVLLYEFKAGLNRYLLGLGAGAPVRSLKEVIEFNERNWEQEMPYFGQELFHRAEAKGPLTDEAYKKALEKCRRLSRKEGIDATLGKHGVDAIVAPTGGLPWLIDLANGDSYTGGSSSPAAVAGYPSITVPAGYAFGLPVGISFFGAAYTEPKLLKLAYAFEQATRARRRPRFAEEADLTDRLPAPAAKRAG